MSATKPWVTAEVLSIGTELLVGATVNTNAAYLGRELVGTGLELRHSGMLDDHLGRMVAAIAQAAERSDLVVLTGGLGPTPDDLTREAVAEWAGVALREDPDAMAHVTRVFAERKRVMSPSNRKQALLPEGAELIPNPAGTAVGLAIPTPRGGAIWAFPGVPWELEAMWALWAPERIAQRVEGAVASHWLRYAGIGESLLAEQHADLLAGENPTVAPYAGAGEVALRASARAASPAEAQALLAPVVAELKAVQPWCYGEQGASLASTVLGLLAKAGQSLSCGESCTGGQLAATLTEVPGASSHFLGGTVAYTFGAKAKALGVASELLVDGAVSRAVAEAMAQGAIQAHGSDWGVGITGWAGPGDHPACRPGQVWFAVCGPEGTSVEERFMGATTPRTVVKKLATAAALNHLRLRLQGLGPDGTTWRPKA